MSQQTFKGIVILAMLIALVLLGRWIYKHYPSPVVLNAPLVNGLVENNSKAQLPSNFKIQPEQNESAHRQEVQFNWRQQPVLYWRHWEERPIRPWQTFFLLYFISMCIVELFPQRSLFLGQACVETFWWALAKGLLITGLAIILAKFLFRSELGAPLGLVVIAFLQLSLLLGFAVVARRIGKAVIDNVGLAKIILVDSNNRFPRFLSVMIGTAILVLILLISSIGALPQIGIRLVVILSVLGFGAILHTRFDTQKGS